MFWAVSEKLFKPAMRKRNKMMGRIRGNFSQISTKYNQNKFRIEGLNKKAKHEFAGEGVNFFRGARTPDQD